jgi:hypothetical protein
MFRAAQNRKAIKCQVPDKVQENQDLCLETTCGRFATCRSSLGYRAVTVVLMWAQPLNRVESKGRLGEL